MSIEAATISSRSRRHQVACWIESQAFQGAIIALIVLNAISLGMETSSQVMAFMGTWLLAFDKLVLAIFVVEILLKLFVYRGQFFRDPWNLFDTLIIGIALLPASGPLAVLRALRILRVLRLVSALPRLRFVVEALLHAVPGISAIAGLLFIIFYIFAVMATELFGGHHPDWFGSIGASMYTLFQIMTLESWSMGIVRPVMATHPYAWLFFIPFILVATFTVLNLFIAIIVDAMQSMAREVDDGAREKTEEEDAKVTTESLMAVQQELKAIRSLLEKSNG